MQLNWKIRFKNKAFVLAFVLEVIALIYLILGAFGVVPCITKSDAETIAAMLIDIIGMLGLFIDPTTPGVKDSDRAMTYGTVYDERIIDESDGAAAEREEMQQNE